MPPPKQFDGPQRAMLRAALLDAFPLPAGFATFLSDRCDKIFLQIVPAAGNYDEQLDRLLLEANAKVWITDLVLAACREAPKNPKLDAFAKAHGFEAPAPGADGSLVPRCYDRFYQVCDFSERFKAAIKGAPFVQKYLLFGEEYEAHRSLVQRLVDERVRPIAADRWQAEGTVRLVEVFEWPVGSDQKVLQKRVRQVLYEECESRADTKTGAYEILAGSPGFREYKVWVVAQQIVLENWDQAAADLLSWYVGDFWKVTLEPNDPVIVLMIQVECKEDMATPAGSGPAPKDQVYAALKGLAEPRSGQPPLVLTVPEPPILLDELLELKEIDVRNWFEQFVTNRPKVKLNVKDETKRVRDAAKRRRNGIRRTDSIEELLTDVYLKWAEQEGVGQ